MISPGKQESVRLVLLTLNILEEKRKKKRKKKTSFLPINYKIHILRQDRKKKKPDINFFLLCYLRPVAFCPNM